MLEEIEKRAQIEKMEHDYEAEQEAIRKANYLTKETGSPIPVVYPKKIVSEIDLVAKTQDVAASRLVRVTRNLSDALKYFDTITMKNYRLFKEFPETALCPKINELQKQLFE